ncbi:hypothetical protein Bbelb_389990 [Branchiostoma belcheri]|nr:hypothetical protein Bbelb_389990 [Branchiostoma belcheri]
MSAMSHGVVTVQEMHCVCSWFANWAPMQREEFLRDLVEKAVGVTADSLMANLDSLSVQDKAPSIFKCQMKLFGQWFEGWTEDDRNELLQRLENIDAIFVARFYDEVAKVNQQRH